MNKLNSNNTRRQGSVPQRRIIPLHPIIEYNEQPENNNILPNIIMESAEPTEELKKEKKKEKHDKSYNGLEFSKYKKVLHDIKMDEKVDDFKMRVNKMLRMISNEDMTYDDNVVMFVLECAEMCFSKPRSGELKLKVSKELLAPYFKNDDILVEKFIDLLLPKIRKSNVLRRNYQRIRIFFYIVYTCFRSSNK